MKQERLLKIPEIMEILGLSKSTVYRMIQDKELPIVNLGRTGKSVRVRLTDLDKFMSGLKVGNK
jgi:excisionase family DNA binding protein